MNTTLLNLWRIWDIVYYHSSRLQYIDKHKNLFRIVFLPYWGERLETSSGDIIKKNDLVLKLHIHNFRLAELIYSKRDVKALGIVLLREVRRSMPGLARYVASHPQSEQIVGVVGTSFLHRGVEHLGFTSSDPIDSSIYKIKRMYLKWMLQLMHPEGKKRVITANENLIIKRIFISRKELLEQYPN